MKIPEHEKLLGARFPPLSNVTFSCLICRRRKTVLAADAFIKWGMHTKVGDVAAFLSRDCDRVDGDGNRLCQVLPEVTNVLSK